MTTEKNNKNFNRFLLLWSGELVSVMGILYILFCMQRGGASLTEICIGVTVSAVFSSLLEPSCF